jgi:uncharacterized protein
VGVEVRPLGVACNIQCQYCYQNPQRDAGAVNRAYDLDAIEAAVAREGGPFTLFGGEPLLVPLSDLERLWAFGLDRFGANGIQTNGSLITNDHIALFRRYKVTVGISIDGPGDLNDVRWAGSLAATRRTTEATEAAIERLCDEHMAPSLIVTLHRHNASPDRLPLMHEWMRGLDQRGVTSARLHLLEVDHADVRSRWLLADEDSTSALLSFARLEADLERLRFDVFTDMRNLLLGTDDKTTCVWNACDPYTTAAVRGVEGDGQATNCGRTNKDGVDFAKADRPGFERYLALYLTPQEHGGCSGCRFFLMCKGQCPGTAIDGDWRNRSEQCAVWKATFSELESDLLEEGLEPLSVSPARAEIEEGFLDLWSRGMNSTVAGMRRRMLDGGGRPAADVSRG